MEKTINQLCFLPLDIPPIPNKEKILQHFSGQQMENYIWWERQVLLGKSNSNDPLGSYPCDWNDDALTHYSSLIQHITTYLPFSEFVYVHLARAKTEILPHVDENYIERPFPFHMTITEPFQKHLKINEPVGYRFLISGNRNSLYLCQKYDPNYIITYQQDKHYCNIPDDVDFFVIRNSQIPHGVDHIEKDPDRLVGFVLGFVDEVKHRDLIKKSLNKFSNNALFIGDIFGTE